VPRHQSKIMYQQFVTVYGNPIFQSILIHPKSDMMETRSSHLIPPIGAPGASNNQEIMDFMRSMAESIEVLRKQKEEFNTRLTAAEARSSRRKESAKKGTKRKDGTEFAKESSQLILSSRITKVRFKGTVTPSRTKSITKSLARWSFRMTNSVGKGLVTRRLLMRDLVVKGIIEISLIGKGDTKRSTNTMSLITTTVMKRWKT
jgi:hypothetical protein